MIKQIYINGFPLAVDNVRHITAVQGLTAPTIDLATYNRGGRDGIVLGSPFYRARTFTIEITILAKDPTNLTYEKDRLLTVFRLQPTDSTSFKTVVFEMSDGSSRTVKAIANKISGSLTPSTSFAMTTLTVQMITEKWYLDGASHELSLSEQNFGGMAIPMSIPMDMSVGAEITNQNQAFNAGNTESLPSFSILGPFESCDIYNYTTDQHMIISAELTENDSLNLDCFDHSAIKNEVKNIRGSVSGDWIMLTPGINQLLFAASSSQSGFQAKVNWNDAYIGI